MISEAVFAAADRYREGFQSAQPFKHVCIDDFFTSETAEASLRDFPPFDREFAIGEYGGKAVVSNICEISPFYAKLHEYFLSRGFLDRMSAITGIEDLHRDPSLYGGGTHENLNGQTLDVHVDFNFQIGAGFHRRANLLLYLNKEWDPAWGGAIELHSNPRRPDLDAFEQFNVIFNRAVIFETNEYSWHGFRKIRLPQDPAAARPAALQMPVDLSLHEGPAGARDRGAAQHVLCAVAHAGPVQAGAGPHGRGRERS